MSDFGGSGSRERRPCESREIRIREKQAEFHLSARNVDLDYFNDAILMVFQNVVVPMHNSYGHLLIHMIHYFKLLLCAISGPGVEGVGKSQP